MRSGTHPDQPPDPAKLGLTVAPSSAYLFDSSNTALGRVSYVTKGTDAAGFFKSKAKKGPFKLEDFQDKFRYQLQDEHQAFDQAQDAASKQLETEKPPDPKNMQAFTEYMGRIQSMQGRNMMRLSLDMYQPNLYGSPTVYVLEERQIGQRTYPTRYVVLYQDQALRQPGYRLVWMTVTDEAPQSGASRVIERRAAGPRTQEGRCGCEEKGRGTRRVDEEKGRGGKEANSRRVRPISKKSWDSKNPHPQKLLQTRHGLAVGRPLQIHLEHDRTICILGLQSDRHPIDHELGQRHGGDVRRLV